MSFFSKIFSVGSKKKSTAELRKIAVKDSPTGLKPLTGRFGVGFIDVEWEDTENLTMGGEEETGFLGSEIPFVLARIYYPSRKEKESTNLDSPDKATQTNNPNTNESEQFGTWLPSSHYFPGYGYFMRLPTLVSSGIGRLLAANVRIRAKESIPLVSIEEMGTESLPVMIFSHGIAGIRTTYSSICCEMASRGVVVVALEHRDGSASMTIDQKGKVYPYRAGPSGINLPMIDYDYRAAQLVHRIKEIKSTAKFIESINEAGDFVSLIMSTPTSIETLKQFKGRLLANRIILTGHSFGGASCFAASQVIPTVTCCVALDPWMFPLPQPSLPIQRTDIDNLIIINEKFSWSENDAAIQKFIDDFRHTDKSLAKVQLLGCGHMDPSDLASIVPAKIIQILRPNSSIPANPHRIIQANVDLIAAHLSHSFPMFSFDTKWEISQLSDLDHRLVSPELNTQDSEVNDDQYRIDPIIKLEAIINYK